MRQQQLSVTTFLSIEFIPRLENWFLQLYVGMLAPTGMPIDMRITSSHSAQGQRRLLAPAEHIKCNAFSTGRCRIRYSAIRAHSEQPPQPLTRRKLGERLAGLAAVLPVIQLLDVRTAWGLGCVHPS